VHKLSSEGEYKYGLICLCITLTVTVALNCSTFQLNIMVIWGKNLEKIALLSPVQNLAGTRPIFRMFTPLADLR